MLLRLHSTYTLVGITGPCSAPCKVHQHSTFLAPSIQTAASVSFVMYIPELPLSHHPPAETRLPGPLELSPARPARPAPCDRRCQAGAVLGLGSELPRLFFWTHWLGCGGSLQAGSL